MPSQPKLKEPLRKQHENELWLSAFDQCSSQRIRGLSRWTLHEATAQAKETFHSPPPRAPGHGEAELPLTRTAGACTYQTRRSHVPTRPRASGAEVLAGRGSEEARRCPESREERLDCASGAWGGRAAKSRDLRAGKRATTAPQPLARPHRHRAQQTPRFETVCTCAKRDERPNREPFRALSFPGRSGSPALRSAHRSPAPSFP